MAKKKGRRSPTGYKPGGWAPSTPPAASATSAPTSTPLPAAAGGRIHVPMPAGTPAAGRGLILYGRPVAGGTTTEDGVTVPARVPLPRSLACAVLDKGGKGGNDGLRFERFCDAWKPDWSDLRDADPKNAKPSGAAEWVAGFNRNVGDKGLLEDADARRQLMLDGLPRHTARHAVFATDWRFVTGLGRDHPIENGFAWHHSLGVPYLPGSAVKGMVKSWCRDWLGAEELPLLLSDLFGQAAEDAGTGPAQAEDGMAEDGAAGVGGFVFLDAIPIEPVRLQADVMTPHYQPYYQAAPQKPVAPGDWFSPNPISFLTVAPGQRFRFAIMARNDAAVPHLPRMFDLLTEALEWVGAGAKTASGYGRFALDRAQPRQ